MLVCHHSGLSLFITPVQSEKKIDGKDSVNTYLLNLIFELFTPLHFVSLVLLECACHHYEFSLL